MISAPSALPPGTERREALPRYWGRPGSVVQARSQIPVPVRITVRVWEPVGSVQASRYRVVKGPFLAGVKVTGMAMSLSGMTGSPWAGLSGAVNGLGGVDVPATVLTWLPVLEMRTWAVACLPTGMFPKFTTGSVVVSRLTAGVPVPVRVTVTLGPLLPAIVNDPVAGPGAAGA